MIQGFYTGISGIKTYQSGIDIISDNLANIDTVGFRGYQAEFSSLFENTLNTNANNSSVDSTVGLGSRLSTTSMDESIGVLMLSERSTDLAIMGEGWFGLQGNGGVVYTRDGSFLFDANRDLVTSDGLHVLGTLGKNIENGVLTKQLDKVELDNIGSQEKLNLPRELNFPVEPTTDVKFLGNLSNENTVRVMSAKAIDIQNNQNNIRLEFKKVDTQIPPGTQWEVKATAQSSDMISTYNSELGTTIYEPKQIYDTQYGVVSFNEKGSLISNTLGTVNNNGTAVKIDLGSWQNGIVSVGESSFNVSSSSNGKVAGELVDYSIGANGQIIAAFSNGEQSSIGSVAIYHFVNDRGLDRLSGSRFMESSNSGRPIFYQNANKENILGSSIANFKLEGSNVIMQSGLTELIVMQRSYDANAKSITTSDEMIQKAINMTK